MPKALPQRQRRGNPNRGRDEGITPRPSLRTGLADFPHPALQLASDSFTEGVTVRNVGMFQAEQPLRFKVSIWPSVVITSRCSVRSSTPSTQDISQPASDPFVRAHHRASARMLEVSIPSP